MNKVIQLKSHPGNLLTRSGGETLRGQLYETIKSLSGEERLIVDFAGVETLSPSFADECFGKLAQEIGVEKFRESVSLVKANPVVRTLVNVVLAERLTPSGENCEEGSTP